VIKNLKQVIDKLTYLQTLNSLQIKSKWFKTLQNVANQIKYFQNETLLKIMLRVL